MIKSKHVNYKGKVFGRVQGVGFRVWTKKIAKKHQLNGWVKNCKDNTLEFEVFGEENKIKKFIEECHKGPIFSKVLKIDVSMVSYTEHKNFEIKV